MESSTSSPNALGSLFSKAYASYSTITVPPALMPDNADDAYAIQHFIIDQCEARIGGWKVGSKSVDGPAHCAPLPQQGIYKPGAIIDRDNYPVLGIELEIFFGFNRGFMPGVAEISEQEVMQSIGTIGASIEIVSSRIAGWPKAPPLAMLADLQSHGALIVGEQIAYRDDFPFQNPIVHLNVDGKDIFKGPGVNPAGDPRRLLCWLVNHCNRRGIAIPAGAVITTGSYTGMHFPAQACCVAASIAGLPPIDFELR
ncbi:MAG: 2-keto-4-pentenoate hydratase [Herbaspirillum sp.]|nr:2-keto-4-pentenoate hydratase [Herbaspirillum sp.]